MKYAIIGIDFSKGNDKTSYIKRNKKTGKVESIKMVENCKSK